MIAAAAILFAGTEALGAERKVIIGFHKTPEATEKGFVESRRGRITKEFKRVKAVVVEIDEAELPGLLSNPDVAYIEEDARIQALEPVLGTSLMTAAAATQSIEYENAWSVAHIGAEGVHNQSMTGAGVSVAVLDTGIDYNHPDLDMNYSGGDNFVSVDPNYHDPMDDSYNSHGTHVAGIIAAELDGAGSVGVAPDASIYAVKVLDGAGFGPVSSVVAGIDWAIANQIDIVNMSIGFSSDYQALADACAQAEAAGVLLVAAAGNTYGAPVLYPAAYPSVIAVGATTIFDEIAPISSSGSEMELVAPGLNVYSTTAGGNYGFLGGTSQAAPHVSGLAALILSAGLFDDIDGDGLVNHHDVRLLMRNTAIDLGDPGFDQVHGYGLVSATNALPGTVPNAITHLMIEKHKGSSKKDWENITITDGVFDVTIANTSLKGIKVLVFEGAHVRRDLSQKFCFKKADAPQEASFSIDATLTSYKLVFSPKGKEGSLADAYIQKQ